MHEFPHRLGSQLVLALFALFNAHHDSVNHAFWKREADSIKGLRNTTWLLVRYEVRDLGKESRVWRSRINQIRFPLIVFCGKGMSLKTFEAWSPTIFDLSRTA